MFKFVCRCGYETDLEEMAKSRPDLKPWEFYCPACGIVVSRHMEMPEKVTADDVELYKKTGYVPGRIVVKVDPQRELPNDRAELPGE
jgi:hypothetical protein